jgi:Transposase DDE domain
MTKKAPYAIIERKRLIRILMEGTMSSVAQIAQILREVLEEEANGLGRETGWQQRERALSGADFVQTLLFGWWQEPEISLDGLTQVAGRRLVQITASGLHQRFTPEAAQMLFQILTRLVQAHVRHSLVETLPFLRPFSAVVLEDSSTIALPRELASVWQGSGRKDGSASAAASVKLFVRLDLRNGTMEGPMLTQGRHTDTRSPLSLDDVPAAGLYLADLGFASGQRFRHVVGKAAGKRYFLSRLLPKTRLQTRRGHRIELRGILPHQVGERLEIGVILPTAGRLPVRLILERVPEEVAELRRARMREEARHQGREANEDLLELCGWSILITNVPRRWLSAEQILVLIRARWQIERLFCLWKAQGCVDSWHSQHPWRILCEVYAKLAAMVIQHWLMVLGCWQDPYRSIVKAAQVCRREAGRVMAGLMEDNLEAVLTSVVGCMQSGCRLNTRKQFPSTAQYLAGTPLTDKQRPHLPKRPRSKRTRVWPAGRGWASTKRPRKAPPSDP